MDIILAIIAILCGITGILGAFMPVLPGPPLSLIGLFLMQWAGYAHFSNTFLIIFTTITLVVSVLDYIAPVWMTKRFGGSKMATNGSMAGLIIGIFFFPPFGMIIGPLIGSFLGELFEKKDSVQAFKIALLSFASFLINTGLKFMISGIMLFYILAALF